MDSSTSKVTLGDEKMPGYTISMDKIDLSLIPIFNHQRRDTKVPLWSPAVSGPGAKYYELQVLAEEGSSKDERLENASTHMCHVCNVDVCISYWQRHTTTTIHKANQAIAQTSLSRMQQMALSTAVTPPAPRTTTYFCHPCSSAVAISKRTAHKQSEQHSSAVLYEQLLLSLARLYESKDNLVIVCEDVSRAICDHATISKDLKSRLFLESKLSVKKDDKKDDEKNNDEEFDDCEFLEREVPLPNGHNNVQTALFVTKNAEKSHLPVKPAAEMKITANTPTGTTRCQQLTNSVRNYVKDGLCLVCKVNVPPTNHNIAEHLNGYNHNEKFKALKANTSSTSDLQLNQNATRTSDSHIIENKSTEKENQTIAYINTNDINVHIKKGVCVLCNVKVTDNISNIKEHVSGRNHTYLQSLVTDEQKLNKTQNSNKGTDTVEGSLNKTDSHVKNGYCYICSMKVPKNASSIKEHVNGRNHTENLQTFRV